jgi:hypothetical protein
MYSEALFLSVCLDIRLSLLLISVHYIYLKVIVNAILPYSRPSQEWRMKFKYTINWKRTTQARKKKGKNHGQNWPPTGHVCTLKNCARRLKVAEARRNKCADKPS